MLNTLGEQGWCSAKSTPYAICELSLLLELFSALKGFPLGTPRQFLLSPKTNKTKFYNDVAPIFQTLDSAIHQINHYPVDKTVLGKPIALSSG